MKPTLIIPGLILISLLSIASAHHTGWQTTTTTSIHTTTSTICTSTSISSSTSSIATSTTAQTTISSTSISSTTTVTTTAQSTTTIEPQSHMQQSSGGGIPCWQCELYGEHRAFIEYYVPNSGVWIAYANGADFFTGQQFISGPLIEYPSRGIWVR